MKANDNSVPVKKIEYNKKDPIHRRATYGIEYPQENIVFSRHNRANNFESITEAIDNDSSKRFVFRKRMTFDLDNTTIRKKLFDKSSFHDQHGMRPAEVSLISFEDCGFDFCFFGGTNYSRVVFRRCTFKRCDFMNAEFSECSFINCHFTECTAYKVIFEKTEINPTKFYESIVVPEYNFPSLDDRIKQNKIRRDWKEMKYYLSRQLLSSSSEVYNIDFIDQSVYLIKKAQIGVLYDRIGNIKEYYRNENNVDPSLFTIIWKWIESSLQIALRWINLKVTKGGTSLFRITLVGVVMVLLATIYIGTTEVNYGRINLAFSGERTFLQNVPYGISLFLGYGYTGFSFLDNSKWILSSFAISGLIWYALVLQILIRKIYR